MALSQKLHSEYHTPRSTGSFGGVDRLKRLNKATPSKVIINFLQSQDTYTKHRRVVHKFKRRKVMVPGRNYLWQTDLVVLNKLGRYNKGYNYILNCIDAFSRYAFSVPIRKKTGSEISEAFEKILQSGYGKCRYLECDDGTEYKNRVFGNFLRSKNIKMYSNFSENGACIVERYNRTLMTRIHKYMADNKTKSYINVLPDIVYSYNHSFHRTLQCAPASITKYNESDVWRTVYKDLINDTPNHTSKLKVGDYVRVKKNKGVFTKGYAQTFGDTIYTIKEVVNSNPTTYKIGSESQNILGTFYKQELSQVSV